MGYETFHIRSELGRLNTILDKRSRLDRVSATQDVQVMVSGVGLCGPVAAHHRETAVRLARAALRNEAEHIREHLRSLGVIAVDLPEDES